MPAPRPRSWIRATFGDFRYRDLGRGRIEILDEWLAENIITLPNRWGLETYAGSRAHIRCHRLIAAKLTAVFSDLHGQNLIHLINTYDGCFVPRHIGWDRRRALSRHSWGVAVDVNVRECPYGSYAAQPAKLLSAFRSHGFCWGGCWSTPDPMHFEVVDL